MFPKLSPFASWPGCMINPQSLDLPMSRINFHAPKDVRATEVLLFHTVLERSTITVFWIGGGVGWINLVLRTLKSWSKLHIYSYIMYRLLKVQHGIVDQKVVSFDILRYFVTKTSLFKYTENFTTKNWEISDKNSDIFSYFWSKYRLWALVRTASARQF